MDVFEHEDGDELKPARYDDSPTRAFGPKLPIKWIAAGLGGLVLVALVYFSSQTNQASDLKQSIVEIHRNDIQPVAAHIREFREGLVGTLRELAARPSANRAQPGLELERLSRRPGIYVRLNESQLADDETLAEAISTMHPDSLGACLGLAPQAPGPLFATREILGEEWLEETLQEEDVLKLRVAERQLTGQVEHDLPLVLDLVQSDYLLFMVVRGETRMEAPVDVYLWDLSDGELLLQTRTLQRGRLLSVRIGVGDVPRVRGQDLDRRAGVVDCSIASSVRALVGQGTPETNNVPESPLPPLPEDVETEAETESDSAEPADEGEPESTEEGAAPETSPDDVS